jgi:hypothetical protein
VETIVTVYLRRGTALNVTEVTLPEGRLDLHGDRGDAAL